VLGITFNYYDKDYTYNKGWQTYVIKAGVYVKEPGKNTELQSGDRFVTIDGVTISTSADIKDVLATHSIGDKIEATVARVVNEKETVVTVTLTCFEQVPEGVTE
jgi:S1-C subfamily serine protease